MTSRLHGKALRLIIVLAAVGGLAGSGFLLHKYRKRAALEASLSKGLKAYDAKQYTLAATELGRYLTGNRTNVDVLLKYADAQVQRRPSPGVEQAVSAWETVVRIDRAQPEAAERLTNFYLPRAPIEAERVARAWFEAEEAKKGKGNASSLAKRQLACAWMVQDKKEKQADALRLVREAIDEDPTDTFTSRLLMQLLVSGAGSAATQGAQSEATSRPVASAPADQNETLRRLLECQAVLEDLVAKAPDAPGPRLTLARFYRFFNLPDKDGQVNPRRNRELVIEHMERAGASPTVTVDQLLENAVVFADMGESARSAASFDLAEKKEPGNADVFVARCRLAMERGAYTEGAEVVDRAFSKTLGESRLELLDLAAEFYARVGRVQDARKCIDELKAVNTDSSVLIYLGAHVDLAEGRKLPGAKALEEAVRRQPKNAHWKLALARALVATKQPERAVIPLSEHTAQVRAELEQQKRPAVSLADLELVDLYILLGRWDEAVQAVRQMEGRQNGSWLAPQILLKSLAVQAEAAHPNGPSPSPGTLGSIAARIKAINEEAPATLNNLALQSLSARVSAWLGDGDEAVAKLKTLRENSTDKQAVTLELVRLLSGVLGRYEDAIAECTEAAKSDDPKAKALFEELRAELLIRHGKEAEGMTALVNAAQQAEGDQRTAIRMRQADLLASQKKFGEAADLLVAIAGESPKNVDVRVRLFEICPMSGRKLDRQQIVDQIKGIEGNDGVTWRFCQARLWFESDVWLSKKDSIEKLLNECILSKPAWFEPMRMLAIYHERSATASKAMETIDRLMALETTTDTLRLQLRLVLIEIASRAEKWADVEAALNAFPPNIENAAIRRAIDGFRLELALRNDRTDQARRILEQRVKSDSKDYRSRLQLVSVLRAEIQLQPNSAKDISIQIDQLLDEADRIAPNDPDVLTMRVGVLVSRGQFDDAIQLCNGALDSGQNPDAILIRSKIWEARGQMAEALNDLQSYTKMEGKAEIAFYRLGQFHYRHGRTTDAVQAWQEGLKRDPKSVEMRGALAEVFLGGKDQGQKDEAVRLIESRLVENPQDPEFLKLRADTLLESNPDEARRAYEQVVKIAPRQDKAFGRLVQLEVARNNPEQAAKLVDEGLAASPNSPVLLMMKARLMMGASPRDAVAAATKLASLQPEDEQSNLLLAEALSQANSLPRAIEVLETFLKRRKADEAVDARLNLARLLVEDRRLDDAETRLAEAEKLRPDESGTTAVRILLLAARKQWTGLMTLAQTELDKRPDALVIAEVAGSQLLTADDREIKLKAIPFFEHLLAKRPDLSDAQAALGMACYQVGDFKRAAGLLEQALAKAPGNLGLLNNLVWITCEELKDPVRAEQLAAKAMKDGADYPNLWDTWGVVLYRLGRTSEATQAFEKARNHPSVSLDTKHSATFHLARLLAETDKPRSLQLLDTLLGAGSLELSASDKDEAMALQATLKGQSGATKPST